jgi:hypothetical protein
MNSLLARCQRAQAELAATLGNQYQFKQVSARHGDFGDLEGFEFNADRCGGFLYLWSSGNCEFHLVDYVRGVEVIPITLRMIATTADADEIVGLLGKAAVNLVTSET